MADTHINAFEQEVEEAKLKVNQAQAELQTARQRFEDKKRELGLTETTEPAPVEPQDPTVKATVNTGDKKKK